MGIKKSTGAMQHGIQSPAVCTGVNTAMRGRLQSGLEDLCRKKMETGIPFSIVKTVHVLAF